MLVLLIKYFGKLMCDAPLPIRRSEFTTKLTLVNLELKFKFHSIKVFFFFFLKSVDLCFGTYVYDPPISFNKIYVK